MNRLKEHYEDVVRPYMMIRHSYQNVMEIPKIEKICVHMTYKNISTDKSHANPSQLALELITGQRTCPVKANKSMASFKIRKGAEVGCKVTLRNDAMYEFLDRLITTMFPRIRDFQGVSRKSFDGRGNYSIGVKNFLHFQEIELDYNLFEAIYGMDIQIITSCRTNAEALTLLSAFQIPFKR